MERLSTGVKGLDEMLNGGIPAGHIVVVVGTYGTGKTTLALHFVYEGLKRGENCIYISFDEDEESILQDAEGFGMNMREFVGKQLEIVRLEAVDVKRSLEKIENDLSILIEKLNAKRMVVDTISVLESLFDERERWSALSVLRQIVKRSGITAMFTTEADKNNPNSSKYGIIEYVADGVIALRRIPTGNFKECIYAVEIVKMRRTKHSRTPKPYTITPSGMVVHERVDLF